MVQTGQRSEQDSHSEMSDQRSLLDLRRMLVSALEGVSRMFRPVTSTRETFQAMYYRSAILNEASPSGASQQHYPLSSG